MTSIQLAGRDELLLMTRRKLLQMNGFPVTILPVSGLTTHSFPPGICTVVILCQSLRYDEVEQIAAAAHAAEPATRVVWMRQSPMSPHAPDEVEGVPIMYPAQFVQFVATLEEKCGPHNVRRLFQQGHRIAS